MIHRFTRRTTIAGFLAVALHTCAPTAHATSMSDYYQLEDVPVPDNLDVRVGAMQLLDDGQLAIAFMRGELYLFDPDTDDWRLFASGFHDPLGMHAIDASHILVGQKPEITRVRDTTGDGRADSFETLTDEFGLSGERGEYLFGPVQDHEGNLFFNLMTNSRDDVSEIPRGDFTGHLPGDRGSVVPYRGWVMKLDAQSGQTIPYASGIRSPNGIGIGPDGRLIVVDNEGEWFGTNYVFHIKQDHFYGHPTSLTWADHWDWRNDGFPDQELSRDQLDDMRTLPILEIPHSSDVAYSPAFPYWDLTDGAFGPFEGQMFIGEVTNQRILRVMLEEVAGELQGAVTTFYEEDDLRRGVNRLAFDADRNALWIGQVDRSWGGGSGLQRMTWNGRTPMDVLDITLTEQGFELTFTKPLDPDAIDPDHFQVQRYFYEFSQSYGSDRKDVSNITVNQVALSDDHRTVSLTLDELNPGYIYDIQLEDLVADDGSPVLNPRLYYTLNRLIDADD